MPDRLDTRSPASVRRPKAARIVGELLRDREAFQVFVRIAASRLTDSSEAEDVVQSAAAAFISSYDPSVRVGGVEAYFVTAVITHAMKANRALSRHPERYSRADVEDRKERAAVDVDVVAAISGREVASRVMATLPPRERLVIAMQQLGFARPEIASALGVSDRGLRKIVTRARASLRRALEAEGGA